MFLVATRYCLVAHCVPRPVVAVTIPELIAKVKKNKWKEPSNLATYVTPSAKPTRPSSRRRQVSFGRLML